MNPAKDRKTSERKMTKMQQIHKASARVTKSMEQITLELSRHLRKKPKSARFAPGSAPGHLPSTGGVRMKDLIWLGLFVAATVILVWEILCLPGL
jgi:hypothetical protein